MKETETYKDIELYLETKMSNNIENLRCLRKFKMFPM